MNRFLGVTFASIVSIAGIGSAVAADMPMKAPPMVAEPVYNWTGFYIGGNVGGGWDDIKSLELPPGTGAFPAGTVFPTARGSGWLGGVQAGYNYQVAPNFLVGLEGEYSWADITDTNNSVSTAPRFLGLTSTTNTKLKDLALGTGRLGYVTNNWLLYGKAGIAWGETTSSGFSTLADGTPDGTHNRFSTHLGWVVGVGAEWGFAPNWSARIEYDHIFFDSRTIQSNDLSTAGVLTNSYISSGMNVDIVRAGVNYRFNWGGVPLLAKY
jgi:outer membrane immunogenic protein